MFTKVLKRKQYIRYRPYQKSFAMGITIFEGHS